MEFAAILALFFSLITGGAQVEKCEHEDGSSQTVCVWDGSRDGNKQGATVLNLDHGRVWIGLTPEGRVFTGSTDDK